MKLASYLTDRKISDSDFADRIGVSRQAIHRYKTGDRIPEQHVISKIYRATSGAVTANDFFNTPRQPQRASA